MIDVLNLALPYFGLIFLGFACGRITRIPIQGLAWMDFFIIYMTRPALFYRILAKTPFEQLSNVPFIVTATLGTFVVLMLSLGIAWLFRRDLAQAAIGQLAGAYGNIGYMGPGLALATVGAQAVDVVRKIALHPLMVASALGALSAALRFEPPASIDRLLQFLANASAPCALFTLGVTVALRRLNGVPLDVSVLVLVKLVLHPALALLLLTAFGPFDPNW